MSEHPDPQARTKKWWAALHTGNLIQSVDPAMRLADTEQAEMVARIANGTDDELARRLEWATGGNGYTILAQIRAEGLGVMVVTQEWRQ